MYKIFSATDTDDIILADAIALNIAKHLAKTSGEYIDEDRAEAIIKTAKHFLETKYNFNF